MNELDRELVFSEAVKAGKRIYYFDVKQSRNGDRYISITESKKIVDGPADHPHFSYEKHKLFLYKEDYEKFVNALLKTLDVAKTGVIPESGEPVCEEQSVKAENADATLQLCNFATNPAETAAETAPDSPVKESKPEEDTFKIDLDF